MTDVRKTYSEVLEGISGKDWKSEKTFEVGNAGVAITVSFLNDRDLKVSSLVKNIPDFSQTSLRMALKRLKENGYFVKKNNQYFLSLDKDTNIEDAIWWGLLANVANGFIERK